MVYDMIALGTVPSGEPSMPVDRLGYAEIGFAQCQRYMALLRQAIGREPEGARLRVRRSQQDFDPYVDVVVEYDRENIVARAYAIRCDREAPTTWS